MSDNGNAKAFGGILAIVALVAGVYAMVEPMNQKIDFITNEIDNIRTCMANDDARERSDAKELASLQEKFREVETQFSGVEARVAELEEWYRWWSRNVPSIDATQNERLKHLEGYYKDD